jgi:ABC-type arginine transport system permease subunit
MLRIIAGLLKGGIVGAGIGYGAFRLGLGSGGSGYLVYALVGFVVGIVCGRPLWRAETIWTPVVKGVVGAGLSCLVYFGGQKLLGRVVVPLPASLGVDALPFVKIPFVFGAVVGIVYGVLVELDDGGDSNAPAAKSSAA